MTDKGAGGFHERYAKQILRLHENNIYADTGLPVSAADAQYMIDWFMASENTENFKNPSDDRIFIDYTIIRYMQRPYVPEVNIRILLMPVLAQHYNEPWTVGVTGWQGSDIVSSGLARSNCPPEVLAYAARHANWHYAVAAARNPNCPEEDRVYAWLRYGHIKV